MTYLQSFRRSSGHSISPTSLNSLSFYTQDETDHFQIGDILVDADDKKYKLVKLSWITANIYEMTLLPEEEPKS